jgi:hypothetical protein
VLHVRAAEVQEYIAMGLACYQVGIRRRIFIEDAVPVLSDSLSAAK